MLLEIMNNPYQRANTPSPYTLLSGLTLGKDTDRRGNKEKNCWGAHLRGPDHEYCSLGIVPSDLGGFANMQNLMSCDILAAAVVRNNEKSVEALYCKHRAH